jgi:hypothetical protein
MLFEEIRNIKSDKKDLRNFGLTFGVVLGLLGGLLWWKGKDTYSIFILLSIAFLFFGLTVPSLLRPLQKAWMTLAVVLGWFMTRLILSILFYVVVTAIGLIARLFGKNFLDLQINRSNQSYWIKREKNLDNSRYEKQF